MSTVPVIDYGDTKSRIAYSKDGSGVYEALRVVYTVRLIRRNVKKHNVVANEGVVTPSGFAFCVLFRRRPVESFRV